MPFSEALLQKLVVSRSEVDFEAVHLLWIFYCCGKNYEGPMIGGRWVYSSSGAVPPLYLLVPSVTMSLSALG